MMPWPLSGTGAGPYLALYVVTLALHAALIGYVVGGAGYAAVAALRGRPDPIALAARDWLPFFLGLAITAGVAPLLFVQLLYQARFYTADLLLGPRWLAIVPALIVGFYALYVHKASAAPRRRLISIGLALGCFGFVAWSWTEHHLVMLDDASWQAFYAAGQRFYHHPALVPRTAMWLAAALPMFAVIAAWQIGAGPARRRLAVLAIAGIAVSTALAAVVRSCLDGAARAGVEAAAPWLVVLIAGRVLEVGAWLAIAVRPHRTSTALVVATAGATATLFGGAVLREAARAHLLGPPREAVTAAGGTTVFAIAVVAVAVAVWWIARTVRRAAPRSGE